MYIQERLIVAKQEHMAREQRLAQIDSILRKQGRGVKLSLRDISKRAGMSKSKHVEDLVKELSDLGFVNCEWGKTRNGLDVRLFSHTGKGL